MSSIDIKNTVLAILVLMIWGAILFKYLNKPTSESSNSTNSTFPIHIDLNREYAAASGKHSPFAEKENSSSLRKINRTNTPHNKSKKIKRIKLLDIQYVGYSLNNDNIPSARIKRVKQNLSQVMRIGDSINEMKIILLTQDSIRLKGTGSESVIYRN